jgi:hypothetical protein
MQAISTTSRVNDSKTRIARENYLNSLYQNAVGNKTNVLKNQYDNLTQHPVESLALERDRQKKKPYINIDMTSPQHSKNGRVDVGYTANRPNEDLDLASD